MCGRVLLVCSIFRVATDVLVRHLMNSAANCGRLCELHDPVNSKKLERTLCILEISGYVYVSLSNVIY